MNNISRDELSRGLATLHGYSADELNETLRGAYEGLKDRGLLVEHQGIAQSFETWRQSLLKWSQLTLCNNGAPVQILELAIDIAEALIAAGLPADFGQGADKDVVCILAAHITKEGLTRFCQKHQ